MHKVINICALAIFSLTTFVVLLLGIRPPHEFPQPPSLTNSISVLSSNSLTEESPVNVSTLYIDDNQFKQWDSLAPIIKKVVLGNTRRGDDIAVIVPLGANYMVTVPSITDEQFVYTIYDPALMQIRLTIPSYEFLIHDKLYKTNEVTVGVIENIPHDSLLKIDDTVLNINSMSAQPIQISSLRESEFILYKRVGNNLLDTNVASFESGPWVDKVADCNINASGTAMISMEIVNDSSEGNDALMLSSNNHPACTNKKFLVNTENDKTYFMFVDYKTNKDGKGKVYYKSGQGDTSYSKEKTSESTNNEWVSYFLPVVFSEAGKNQIDIYLYADSDGTLFTQTKYDNLRIFAYSEEKVGITLYDNHNHILLNNVALPIGESSIKYSQKDISNLLLGQNPSFEDGLWNKTVSDCNKRATGEALDHKMQVGDMATDGLKSLLLSSKNHPACTNKNFNIKLSPEFIYNLSFDYKTLNGNTAKFYYKFNGTDASEYSKVYTTNDTDWKTVTSDMTPLNLTDGFDIYFYAQSSGNHVTTLYDNVQLKTILPFISNSFQFTYENEALVQIDKKVDFHATSPWRWLLKISDIDSPFLLVMPTQYDANARMETVSKHSIGEELHYKVNGYNDSWLISPDILCMKKFACTQNADGTYNLDLVIEFTPQRWFYLGLLISGTTLASCLIFLVYDGTKRWRLRRQKYHLDLRIKK